jgi:hypothetical protein
MAKNMFSAAKNALRDISKKRNRNNHDRGANQLWAMATDFPIYKR